MRRTERLFQIIQILRGARAPVTAGAMASELDFIKEGAEALNRRLQLQRLDA